MKTLPFCKMQGAGNDFVVLDGMQELPCTDEGFIRRLADRKFGVGCDQVLLLAPLENDAEADFEYRIFNNTGEEIEQCGNGARCIARFAILKGYAKGPLVRLRVRDGVIAVTAEQKGDCMTVDMGAAKLDYADIPFDPTGFARRRAGGIMQYGLWLETRGDYLWFSVVNLGNPHAVVFVEEELSLLDLAVLGPTVQNCGRFPEGVNVSFVKPLTASEADIRVYERGSGETLACGTGTCASFIAGRLQGRFGAEATFHARGGDLHCRSNNTLESVMLTGNASVVFEGFFPLPDGEALV